MSYLLNSRISFIFVFLVYLCLSWFGYGTDNDIYGIIFSGQNLILNGEYQSSRFQGALIPELLIGVTSLLGGYHFSNFVSVVLGTSSLIMFYIISKNFFDNYKALVLIFLVALNPYYILASTTSMDYIYSIFFILSTLLMLNKKYFFLAAISASMAISSRLSNSLIIFLIYFYYLYLCYDKKDLNLLFRYFLSGVAGVFFVIFLFLPVFVSNNYSLEFFNYSIGNWTIYEHFSRFIYKNIMLFGLIPFFIISFLLVYNIKKIKFNVATSFMLVIFLIHELMFLKIPLEISYLLPLIFIVFFTITHIASKKALFALSILVLLNNFITLDFLKVTYNETGTEAINAKVGLFIEEGIVYQDIEKREEAYVKYKHNIISEKNVPSPL